MEKILNKKRLFSDMELKELATPLPDRIVKSIKNNEFGKAIEIAKELKESRITLHDFFLESSMILWSWLAGKKARTSLKRCSGIFLNNPQSASFTA